MAAAAAPLSLSGQRLTNQTVSTALVSAAKRGGDGGGVAAAAAAAAGEEVDLQNNSLTADGAQVVSEALMPEGLSGLREQLMPELRAAREKAQAVARYVLGEQLGGVAALSQTLDRLLASPEDVDALVARGGGGGSAQQQADWETGMTSRVRAATDDAAAAAVFAQIKAHYADDKRRALGSLALPAVAGQTSGEVATTTARQPPVGVPPPQPSLAPPSLAAAPTDAFRADALRQVARGSVSLEYVLYCLCFFRHATSDAGGGGGGGVAAGVAADLGLEARRAARDGRLEEDLRLTYVNRLREAALAKAAAAHPPAAHPPHFAALAHHAVTTLRLSGNAIGDAGAAHVALALRYNATLRRLELDRCAICDAGGEQLADALRCGNTTLRALELAGNALTDAAGVAFVEAFASNDELATLGVRGNLLSAEVEGLLRRCADDNRRGDGSQAFVQRLARCVRVAAKAAPSTVSQQAPPPHSPPALLSTRVAVAPPPVPEAKAASAATRRDQLTEEVLGNVRTLVLLGKTAAAVAMVEEALRNPLLCRDGAAQSRGVAVGRDVAGRGKAADGGVCALGFVEEEEEDNDGDACVAVGEAAHVVDECSTSSPPAVANACLRAEDVERLVRRWAASPLKPAKAAAATSPLRSATAATTDEQRPFFEQPATDYEHFMNAWGSINHVSSSKRRRYLQFLSADKQWKQSDWQERNGAIRQAAATAAAAAEAAAAATAAATVTSPKPTKEAAATSTARVSPPPPPPSSLLQPDVVAADAVVVSQTSVRWTDPSGAVVRLEVGMASAAAAAAATPEAAAAGGAPSAGERKKKQAVVSSPASSSSPPAPPPNGVRRVRTVRLEVAGRGAGEAEVRPGLLSLRVEGAGRNTSAFAAVGAAGEAALPACGSSRRHVVLALLDLLPPEAAAAAGGHDESAAAAAADTYEYVSNGDTVAFHALPDAGVMRYTVNGTRRPPFSSVAFDGVDTLTLDRNPSLQLHVPVRCVQHVLYNLHRLSVRSSLEHTVPPCLDPARHAAMVSADAENAALAHKRTEAIARLQQTADAGVPLTDRICEEKAEAVALGVRDADPVADAEASLDSGTAAVAAAAADTADMSMQATTEQQQQQQQAPGPQPPCEDSLLRPLASVSPEHVSSLGWLSETVFHAMYDVLSRQPDYTSLVQRVLVVGSAAVYLFCPETGNVDHCIGVDRLAKVLVGRDGERSLHLALLVRRDAAGEGGGEDGEGDGCPDMMLAGRAADLMQTVRLLKAVRQNRRIAERLGVARLVVDSFAGLRKQVCLERPRFFTVPYVHPTSRAGQVAVSPGRV